MDADALPALVQAVILTVDPEAEKALLASLGLQDMQQLASRKTLNLTQNQLTAIPESIGQLVALQTLDLRRNKLTMLPESIGHLVVLNAIQRWRLRIHGACKSCARVLSQCRSRRYDPLSTTGTKIE